MAEAQRRVGGCWGIDAEPRESQSLSRLILLQGKNFFLIFIGVQFIYNAVLVSGVQQSERLYIYSLFSGLFCPIEVITEY